MIAVVDVIAAVRPSHMVPRVHDESVVGVEVVAIVHGDRLRIHVGNVVVGTVARAHVDSAWASQLQVPETELELLLLAWLLTTDRG